MMIFPMFKKYFVNVKIEINIECPLEPNSFSLLYRPHPCLPAGRPHPFLTGELGSIKLAVRS
jgi:hypothetical protein